MKTESTRITDYVLGELTGTEREMFENEMATNPALLEEVRQTQALCESLSVNPESEASFSEEERAVLLTRIRGERLEATEKKSRAIWSRIVVYGGLAAAACVMLSLSVPAVTSSRSRESRQLASTEISDSTAVLPTMEGASTLTRQSDYELAAKAQAVGTLIALPLVAATSMPLDDSSRPEMERSDKQLQANLGTDHSVSSGKIQDELNQQLAAAPASLVAMDATAITSNLPHTQVPGERRAFSLPEKTQELAGLAGAAVTPSGDWKSKEVKRDGVPMASLSEADSRTRPDVKLNGTGAVFGVAPEVDVMRGYRPQQQSEFNAEGYDYQEENRFLNAKENQLSTFSIDVDTASYSNVRRFLQQQNQLPPKGAVRTEELINYFPYTYPQPEGTDPFSVNVEVSKAPWNPEHELVRIALKGRELAESKRPVSNLVFLIDVSGSMDSPDKLPLLKKSLIELTARLAPKDRVAIVVYAGSSGLVLPSTADKGEIRAALDRLNAGGSTNGADGIKLAYREARENFIEEGNNRVILCTDGDFNVGITNEQALVDLIEKQRASGIFLSVLGFGTGNLKDSQMEKIADKGNGNYAYIDSIAEGRKVLGEQMGGTLFAIAKDVKIQVEFNPAVVAGYRLIGYENRVLAKEDFNNDKKDAGEIGAGHTVTAFYEVVPAGKPLPDADSVDALKYQTPVVDGPKSETRNPQPSEAKPSQSNELLTVKLRYKQPDGDTSKLLAVPVANEVKEWTAASEDFRFAAAVAAFGLKLRGSKSVQDLDWAEIQKLARPNLGEDPGSYRAEFLTLIEKARRISGEDEDR